MSEPELTAVNSYAYVWPGMIGSCVTNGTPSWKKSANSTPWKWIPVVSFRLVVKMARTLSPWLTRIVGPGHWPLKPSAAIGGSSSSTFC